jgi:hypothetical protein
MKMVFSRKEYVALVILISASFFVIFNILDEHLFFSPFLVFHVPPDGYVNFVLSTSIIAMLGIVISMNVYMFRVAKFKLKESATWLSGSFIATATGACGCTATGFSIVSAFGGAGILASSFLTNYQIPLRILSLAIIVFAYYSVRKNMVKTCFVNRNQSTDS